MISSYLKVEDDTLGLIDVAESFNSLTTAVNEKQEEIKTTSNLSLATLDATGLVSCGDLTVSGKTITTLVNEASGSGLTKSDIDDKQDKLTAGSNITIDTTTNTISATNEVTQNDLTSALSLKQQKITASVQLTTNKISSSDITGRIGTTISFPNVSATETLLVEETDINTLIDNKISSSSSETIVFVATVLANVTNFRADQETVLPYDKVNIDIGGGYNNSTYKYTVKKAGVYMFLHRQTQVIHTILGLTYYILMVQMKQKLNEYIQVIDRHLL